MGKIHKQPAFFVLIMVLALAMVGLVLTRGSGQPSVTANKKQQEPEQQTLVDQRPLQMARAVTVFAATPNESDLAQQALRLADHEVDLTFTSALRQASQHPEPVSQEARQLDARVKKIQAVVAGQQANVVKLTKSVEKASETEKDDLNQQLQLAQAQLALEQYELDDAKEDLARSGGDARRKIQRMLDEHEASQHEEGDKTSAQTARAGTPAKAEVPTTGSLLAEIQTWNSIRVARNQVRQAQQDATAAALDLARGHDALERQIRAEQSQVQRVATATARALSKQAAAAKIAALQHSSEDQKTLTDFDRRLQDQQELAEVYGAWRTSLQSRQQSSLHGILQSLAWIIAILLAILIADQMVDRFFSEPAADRRRLLNLRVVLRFVVQALGLLVVLFIAFGKPSEMTTILGLAGAGLTVALKDFIVGFFGWFVLMGRNGLRLGDWVEINGVGGEVVEIGLLRTVLLETGNWTDAGHPTGRKVAFVNSFAIEGHFFNFSTSGQWLWDELQILVPTGEDPYPVIEKIRSIVVEETESNARLAEQEWQHITRRYGIKAFAAGPSISLRPTSLGVEVVVRYITHAHERHEVRARLNQAVVELLHGRRPAADPPKTLAATSGGKAD